MTTYAWPGWKVDRFQMRILPNTRVFVGPYTPTTQVLDLLGERWTLSLDLTLGNDSVEGAAKEAFFDRLKGPANLISMWNLRFPVPQGTLRDGGGPVQWKTSGGTNVTWKTSGAVTAVWQSTGPKVASTMLQLSNQLPIRTSPGVTVFAGDHVGPGQLFRAMANATADAYGLLTVEVQPRARADIAAGTAVVCTAPTANFMLKADGVPIVWRPGMFEGTSLELIEVF